MPANVTPTTDSPVVHPASDDSAKKVHEKANPAENRNAAAPVDDLGNRPETNATRTKAHSYKPRTQEENLGEGINPASGMPHGDKREMNVVPPPGDGHQRNEEKMKGLEEEGLKARNAAFKSEGEPSMGA